MIELNEAFAAQALAVMKDLDLDPERTNPNGGAIALGHPIGATGSLITAKCLAEMERGGHELGARDALHRRRSGHRAAAAPRRLSGGIMLRRSGAAELVKGSCGADP